jgi:hypothetical protein
MAYLHCHNCGWEQDDFWKKDGWSPVKSVESWREDFLSDKFWDKFSTDPIFIQECGDITFQEVLAREFEKNARKIRNMKYRTMDEFRELNPERKCPMCGKRELDID